MSKVANKSTVVFCKTENLWKCNMCNYSWRSSYFSVCSKCNGKKKLAKYVFDKLNKIELYDDEKAVKWDKTIQKWKCGNCEYTWSCSNNFIVQRRRTCPKCHNETKVMKYVLEKFNDIQSYIDEERRKRRRKD